MRLDGSTFEGNAAALVALDRAGRRLHLLPALQPDNPKDTMPELILNRITDRLRENTGAKSSSELLDILAREGLAAMNAAGAVELTGRTLAEARELIDGLEEAILTGQRVDLDRFGWRIDVELSGTPAHDVDRPEDRPLVDDVVIYRRTRILSEVLL